MFSSKNATKFINHVSVLAFILFLILFYLQNEKAFTEEEEEKLQAAFDLSSKDLGNILDTISFVLEQAAYHNAKSNALGKQLQALELTEEKVW